MSRFMPAMFRGQEKKNDFQKIKLSEYCTVAIEALLFMLIENGYAKWAQEAKNSFETSTHKDINEFQSIKPLFTSKKSPKGKKQNGKKICGISQESIDQYNYYFEKINKHRQSSHDNDKLETNLKNIMKLIYSTENIKKGKI